MVLPTVSTLPHKYYLVTHDDIYHYIDVEKTSSLGISENWSTILSVSFTAQHSQ
jgi:hypothetical protein